MGGGRAHSIPKRGKQQGGQEETHLVQLLTLGRKADLDPDQAKLDQCSPSHHIKAVASLTHLWGSLLRLPRCLRTNFKKCLFRPSRDVWRFHPCADGRVLWLRSAPPMGESASTTQQNKHAIISCVILIQFPFQPCYLFPLLALPGLGGWFVFSFLSCLAHLPNHPGGGFYFSSLLPGPPFSVHFGAIPLLANAKYSAAPKPSLVSGRAH